MRNALKRLFYGAIHASGLSRAALRKNRRCVPVLFYHGVTDQRWPGILDCEKKHILAENFERQLVFIKENFQVIPLLSYVAALRGAAPIPESCAVLTFDDGYADNFTAAYPLLKKHGLPATIFLASDFVTKGTPLWVDRLAWAFERTALGDWHDPANPAGFSLADDNGKAACYLWVKRRLKLLPDAEREELLERICAALIGSRPLDLPALYAPLSKKQVREMAGSGLVEIGSHGCRHAILCAMSLADARRELMESKKALEEFCGRPVQSFSYPNGDFNAAVASMAAEAGYACAVAGGLRLNNIQDRDPYAIARLALAEDDSTAMIAATLGGIRGRVISWSAAAS